MRLLFILLIAYFSLLNAGEVQRIESIVSDINKLRSDYARVRGSIVEMEVRLEEEKEKNKILHEDLKLYSNYTKKEKDYKNKIVSLENKISKLKKSLKPKKTKQKVCKKQTVKVVKTIVVVKKDLNNQSIDEDNVFPALQMKKQFKTSEVETKAYAYRVNKQAKIYDGVDGVKIDEWEKLTSFTSNKKTKTWIKITGYFVDKVWRSAQRDMWVKASDASKRK